MDENRRHKRTPIDIPVEFVRANADASTDAADRGRAADLSLGGMFVETQRAYPFGTQLQVRMALVPGKPPSLLPAIVRWADADGMGLQFGLLGARDTHAITELTKV